MGCETSIVVDTYEDFIEATRDLRSYKPNTTIRYNRYKIRIQKSNKPLFYGTTYELWKKGTQSIKPKE